MLEPNFALPTSANIYLHLSTDAIFVPFVEVEKDLLQKFNEDMMGGVVHLLY